jgi:general stress protein YciG
MANRPENEDETMAGSDRERQREVSNESDNDDMNGSESRGRSNRGFASMDPNKQKEIASKGGRAAHAKGTAHEFDSNEAREAGRKGGMAVSRNRDHMAMIGRRGGEARGNSRNRPAAQANTQGAGSASEGAMQNTRGQGSEREVNIPGQSEGYANSQRGNANSLGGENRAAGNNGAAEQNPNH